MKPNNKKSLRVLVLSALFAATTPLLAFEDPTRVPAIPTKRLLSSPMTAIANAGDRLVAVGQRGHVAFSDDNGQTWQQARSPVSSDLVAVSFADAQNGWAVGHGGMVLHTQDAGATWTVQLTGLQTGELIKAFYSDAATHSLTASPEVFVEREEILDGYGGTQPLMAVHFTDSQQGFVAGLFNRLLFTRDGGKTWEPWQHKVDNPGELHFYSFAQGKAGLFMTGEQGKVWRFDAEQEAFVDVSIEYGGTLFGALVHGDTVLVYGMRGSLFRSTDKGASWQRIAVDTTAGITSARVLDGGRIVLGTLGGELQLSQDNGRTFTPTRLKDSMPYFGLASTDDNRLALVGARGLQRSAAVDIAPAKLVKDAIPLSTTALGAEYGHRH